MDPESTLYISSNDTMAEDSGTYLCQFSITILNRDNFTYANSSTVMLTGNISVYTNVKGSGL